MIIKKSAHIVKVVFKKRRNGGSDVECCWSYYFWIHHERVDWNMTEKQLDFNIHGKYCIKSVEGKMILLQTQQQCSPWMKHTTTANQAAKLCAHIGPAAWWRKGKRQLRLVFRSTSLWPTLGGRSAISEHRLTGCNGVESVWKSRRWVPVALIMGDGFHFLLRFFC